MKKRIFLFLAVLALLITLLPIHAFADLGPKASVVIDIQGLAGERYYVTLLSSISSYGPYSAPDPGGEPEDAWVSDGEEEVWRKFAAYEDPDGYHFLQYFEDCSDGGRFSWNYMPPNRFKILLYLPDQDRFVASDGAYGQYAFDSYYTATVTGQGAMTVKQSYDYTGEVLSFAARVIVTVALEIAVALLFGFTTKKQLLLILIANLVTQSLLNFLLNLIGYHQGGLMMILNYVWMELLVFAIEAVVYSIWLVRVSEPGTVKKWKPPVYALCANLVSFSAGFVLILFIPVIL